MPGDEPKTIRMIDLLRTLLSGGSVIKQNFCTKWGIVPRTFERYLNDLEELYLHLDRESVVENGRKALKITLRQEQPPGPLVKPEAHLAFLVSKILLKSYAPGLEGQLDKVLKEARTSPLNELNYLAFFPAGEHSEELGSLLVTVSMAIQNRRVLAYRFSGVMRQVRPYGIICYHNHWYVYGFEEFKDGEQSDQEKLFRTDRIRDLKPIDKGFTYPEKFDMKSYLQDSIGLFFNSKPCTVKVKVNQRCAHYFRTRKHFASQKILEELDNGGLILEYRVNHSFEFMIFAKAWIPNMVILSPEDYRSMMIELLHEAVSSYGGGSVSDSDLGVKDPQPPVKTPIATRRPRGVWNPPVEIREYVNQACEMILKRCKDYSCHLIIYGSCVRGSSTPADIDIAIDSKKPLPAKLLAKIHDDLRRSEIPYPVDLDQLSQVKPGLAREIENHGVRWSRV